MTAFGSYAVSVLAIFFLSCYIISFIAVSFLYVKSIIGLKLHTSKLRQLEQP